MTLDLLPPVLSQLKPLTHKYKYNRCYSILDIKYKKGNCNRSTFYFQTIKQSIKFMYRILKNIF
jgi:hypothetical protein